MRSPPLFYRSHLRARRQPPPPSLRCKSMMERVCAPGATALQKTFLRPSLSGAGKTGTARATSPGGGYKGHRASFAGYFPAEKPRFTHCSGGQRPTRTRLLRGVVAAPVFRAIADHLSWHPTRPGRGNLALQSCPVSRLHERISQTPDLAVRSTGPAFTMTHRKRELPLPVAASTARSVWSP